MPDTVRTAQTFLEQYYAGELAKATEAFGPELRAAVSDAQLARLLEAIHQQYGRPLRHSGTRTSKTFAADADIIYLFWDFEKQRLDARVTVNAANQIIGLSFETPVIR